MYMFANRIFAQVCTIASFVLVYFAHTYETVGHGLNPWIALPIASVMMIVPHLFREE